jgi:hypothetical protein
MFHRRRRRHLEINLRAGRESIYIVILSMSSYFVCLDFLQRVQYPLPCRLIRWRAFLKSVFFM